MNEKKQCIKCLQEKSITNFYKSFSEWHGDGLIPYCKHCLKEKLIEDNYSTAREIMRVCDKPFKTIEWESARKNPKETLGIYLKNINLNDKYENYDHSLTDTEINASFAKSDETNSEHTEDAVKYWGKGYLKWEIDFLEDEMMKLTSSFECPDYGMEMIMRDICFINLDIEKVRQERKANGGTEITKLIKTRSDLMNDANMKPIQSTGAEGNDQITFGTLIKKWENERPVPRPLEDEMKEYIDTFMVGHLAKMEGLNNELTAKYDKALSEYTINFSDINKDEEEYDD